LRISVTVLIPVGYVEIIFFFDSGVGCDRAPVFQRYGRGIRKRDAPFAAGRRQNTRRFAANQGAFGSGEGCFEGAAPRPAGFLPRRQAGNSAGLSG